MCFTALFAFLFSRTCDVSCTCRVSNPKPTIKCFVKNHRLFIHNENYKVSQFLFKLACTDVNLHSTELGNKLCTALKAQGNYIQCGMLVCSNMLHFMHLHKHGNTTCMKAQGNTECMHGMLGMACMLVSFTYQILFTCLGHTTCDEYC